MRFLVLGATGATGSLVVQQATAAGHTVSAFVRESGRLPAGDRVTDVVGDVRDHEALAKAMAGVDAVISTLGIGKARNPANLIADSTQALVRAAEETGTSRLVMMSSFGVGASLAKGSALLRLLYRGGAATFADKAAGERVLTASGLDWTVAYPVMLTGKPSTGGARAVDLSEIDRLPGLPRIPRADVASFLLDAACRRLWCRRIVVLTGKR